MGTVARLTTDKGVDKIARLVHSKPDIRLVIVGEGPLKQELEGLVNAKQVMMIPSLPRPQLMSLYKALDLFILGSMEMDPFGMVAAEAMWWGTPVLMTDQCGIGADLQSGREAMIVEARYSSMDKALKKLMKDRERRERLGRSGQDFVKKNYQFKDMVKAFIKILDF